MTPLYCPHLKAINGWYNEVKDYKFTARPWSDNQANFAKIGHFTQLVSACQAGLESVHIMQLTFNALLQVWKGTTTLGCGRATSRCGTYIVCQYRAQGNIVGDSPFRDNVLPPA